MRFDLDGNLTQKRSNQQAPEHDPTMSGFFVDALGRFVTVGTETSATQLTRFRKDGRLDWRGVIDYDETQRIRWPDDRFANFPDTISFDLFIKEWLLPAK